MDRPRVSVEPLKVLFISHDAGMLGAQRTLMTFLTKIDRREVSPLLVVPYSGVMDDLAAEQGIPVFVKRLVHWVPGSSVSTIRKRLRYLYEFFRTLPARCRSIERLIAYHGVDLVYTNTVTCVEGAIAARLAGKPHIWHIHEHLLRNSELSPMLPSRVYCAAIAFLSRAVIFCSRALAKDYPRLSGKTTVVPNGLPFLPLRDRQAARQRVLKEFGIDPGAKIVGVVGALHPRKDHLTFLAAAERVSGKVRESVFLIVGSGFEEYTEILRKRMKDLRLDSKVLLLGWRDDIPDLMAAIDVLVISSEQESFGLTTIEALAMETPVVATRCGGPEEVLSDGEDGLLVPVKDPSAMADAIVKLLTDPVLARRMGKNGRRHVSDSFGVDRYVDGIRRVIREAGPREQASGVTVGG